MNLLAFFLCIGVIITIVPESKQAFLWHKPAQPQPNPGKIIHFIVRGTPAAGSTVTSAGSSESTAGDETLGNTSTAAGGDETTAGDETLGNTSTAAGGDETTASNAGGPSGGSSTASVVTTTSEASPPAAEGL